MSDIQKEFYEGSNNVYSDLFGLVNRDNRNHLKKQELIIDRIRADYGKKILEVGCGDGLHARQYDVLFDYTGFDISESLINATQKRVGPSARLLVADAKALPLRNNSFHAVVGNGILHHIDDIETALREWCRVTKPGGSVTVTEPNYWFPKDFFRAHLFEEEKNLRNMSPRSLRKIIDDLPYRATVEPVIYTLPWPKRLHGAYDRVDTFMSSVPIFRWLAQIILIHIEVT